MKTDVVIVGGGLIGCATAYYLAKKKSNVIVIEKDAGVGLQASGRNAGMVRQQARKAALPLAMASVRLWAALAQELENDLGYTRTGYLKIALDEAGVAVLENEMAWEHAHGLTEVRMLSPDECRDKIIGLTDRVVAGKFCPTDGIANPMLVTPAYARAAQRLGAEIKTRTTVTGLLRQGSAVRGVTTEQGEIEAEVVVNAAGPWACHLNESIGCATPITPGLSQLMFTERRAHNLVCPVGVLGFGGYFVPTHAGNMVLGISGVPNKYGYSTRVEYSDITAKAAQMLEILPWLSQVSVIRTMSGITEYTPDGEPYIGAVPGTRGFFTAVGFHGQGFCLGPIVGKILADLITGKESSISLATFKPDRFARVQG